MSDAQDNRLIRPLFVLNWVLMALLASVVGLLGYARLGDPRAMPTKVYRLAGWLGNPHLKPEVPVVWVRLCEAWNGWLGYLETHGPRLLQTEDLWEPDDNLRAELNEFVRHARELHPAVLVPEAAGVTSDLFALGSSPPEVVLQRLQVQSVVTQVAEAGARLQRLSLRLEAWPRWSQLRALQAQCETRGLTKVVAALKTRVPPVPGGPGYRLNLARTLRYLDDLARDREGMLAVAARWGEFTRLSARLKKSGGTELQALPDQLLSRLSDQPSLGAFADSLVQPIEEMRREADSLTPSSAK